MQIEIKQIQSVSIKMPEDWDKLLPFKIGMATEKLSDIWAPCLFNGSRVEVLHYLDRSIEWCNDTLQFMIPENKNMDDNWVVYPDDPDKLEQAKKMIRQFRCDLRNIYTRVHYLDGNAVFQS
jgi:hypothetical protein